jgi:drug/metabolite transporter (DMT)-like permease
VTPIVRQRERHQHAVGGPAPRLALAACAAMAAFAGNSLLCRMALGTGAIDAASFTTIRFCTGALALLVFATASRTTLRSGQEGTWLSAAVLLVYAFPFAYAYARLATGTGALVLFGTVQATMLVAGVLAGERPSRFEWAGLVTAAAGLVWLVAPGLDTSPSPFGVALMAIAGAAWGAYSLLGRRSRAPLATTVGTFVRLAPATVVVGALAWPAAHASARGVILASVSGALTSGGGYVVWNYALRHLTATRAAVLQLSVPALAALGGVAVLDEPVTLRLITAAALILGGIALAIAGRTRT